MRVGYCYYLTGLDSAHYRLMYFRSQHGEMYNDGKESDQKNTQIHIWINKYRMFIKPNVSFILI